MAETEGTAIRLIVQMRRTLSALSAQAVDIERRNRQLLRDVSEARAEGATEEQISEALGASNMSARAVETRDLHRRAYWAVNELKVWTNEDGKRFVFEEDLATALEFPGYPKETK